MSQLGQSRHFDRAPLTSGLPQQADIFRVERHVLNVPATEVTNIHFGHQSAREIRPKWNSHCAPNGTGCAGAIDPDAATLSAKPIEPGIFNLLGITGRRADPRHLGEPAQADAHKRFGRSARSHL
jgi:hypothetical protein